MGLEHLVRAIKVQIKHHLVITTQVEAVGLVPLRQIIMAEMVVLITFLELKFIMEVEAGGLETRCMEMVELVVEAEMAILMEQMGWVEVVEAHIAVLVEMVEMEL